MLKTISSIIFPLITFPYISRVLGPNGIGVYNWANSYVGYFSLIASLGITTYAIREVSAVRDNQAQVDNVASQIFSINIVSMLIAYISLFLSLLAFRFLDNYQPTLLILSLTIVFSIIGTDWVNSAFEDFQFIAIRTMFFQLIALILMFVFVKTPSDVDKYAWISVISASGASFVNIFYRKRFCRIRFTFHMEMSQHIKPIFAMFGLILVQSIYNNSDITMLGVMRDNVEVGYYTTAVKMSLLSTQIVASVAFVILPRLSHAYQQHNYTEINLLLNRGLQFLIGFGFPICVGVIALSRQFVLLIGGAQYEPAVPALCFLMLAFVFSIFGGSFIGNLILLPSKREKKFLLAFLISVIINLVLNWLLIPIGGATAAAFTTMIAELILLLILRLYVEKEICLMSFKKVLLAPLVGSVLIFAWCFLINLNIDSLIANLLIAITGSIILYAGTLFFFKYPLFMDLLEKKLGRFKR